MQYVQPPDFLTMPKNKTDKIQAAVKLLMEYEKHPAKADEFLEHQYSLLYKYGEERRFCQFIFLTVLRNKRLIDEILALFLKKQPRPMLFALLKCASAEIAASAQDKCPQIIHSWVEYAKNLCSLGESKLANAVLRRFSEKFSALKSGAKTLSDFSLLYSHPLWLAKRFSQNFGEENAVEIMRKNQDPSEVFLRVQNTPQAMEEAKKYARFLDECEFENFFKIKAGALESVKPILQTPYAYIQDPATRFAPELLDPKKSEKILDLCAAPGGKSRAIADIVRKKSPEGFLRDTLLASVDKDSPRLGRLKENLSKIDFLKTACVACDLEAEDLQDALSKSNLPTQFDAILIDAPCSNTGVLRRRPDARWRLKESDIFSCKKIQISIIKNALPLLKDGGRLVYSTCSIDPEENLQAPREAIKDSGEYKIVSSRTILPGTTDGAGLCLIKKIR